MKYPVLALNALALGAMLWASGASSAQGAQPPMFLPGLWVITALAAPGRPITGRYCFAGSGFPFTAPPHYESPRGTRCSAGKSVFRGNTVISHSTCVNPMERIEVTSRISYQAERLRGIIVSRFTARGREHETAMLTISVRGHRLGPCPNPPAGSNNPPPATQPP